MKADSLHALEGSRPEYVMASIQSHRRGLRPDHAFTGVTRELGRSNCFLAQKGRESPIAKLLALEVRSPSPSSEFRQAENTKEDGQARYCERIANSKRERDGQLEVLADHSTDSPDRTEKEGK